jgi:putative NADPH-quinone reductase
VVVLDARHHERLDRPGLRLRFAYGVGEHSDRHWGDRYGEGTLAGKRAMLIVTYRRLGGALRTARD